METKTLFGLALLLCSSAVTAETRWEVDESQLPPGQTKEAVIANLEELDALSAKEQAKEEAELQRQAERVKRVTDKYQAQIEKAERNDPELRALGEKLKAGMEAMRNSRMSDEEIAERLQRMAPDVAAYRAKGLAKAGINEHAINDEILREINGNVASRSADSETAGDVVLGESGEFIFEGQDDTVPEPGVTSRGETKYILSEPWPYARWGVEITSRNMSQVIDQRDGYYTADAWAEYAGSGTNRAGLWHYFTIPSGTKRIRVLGKINAHYSVSANAILAGGAHAKASSVIRVYDGSKLLCYKYKVHSDLWGLIAALFSRYGDNTLYADCEFDAPPAGRKLTIKFESAAYVNAWGAVAIAHSGAGGRPVLEVTVTK